MVLAAFAKASAAKAVYTDSAFFDAAACLRIRRVMDAGRIEPADILYEEIATRDDVRRAYYVDVDPGVLADVEARLDARRDAIAAHFGVPLVGREGAGFVRYPEGGFYKAHRDCADVPSWPNAAQRRVATVVFLNDDFTGGVLRLIEGDAVDLQPRAGTMVAFSADLLHEVTVVRAGIRDAIVDWFY